MKKIVQIMELWNTGGAEKVCGEYYNVFEELNYKTLILYKRGARVPAYGEAKDYINYIDLVCKILNWNASVVVVHSLRMFFVLCFLGVFRKFEIIFVSHFNYNNKKLFLIALLSFIANAEVVATSNISFQKLKRFIKKNIRMINNFVSKSDQLNFPANYKDLNIKAERIIVGFVGMFKEGKRAADLGKLAHYLSKEKCFLLIVGDGVEKQNLIQELNASNFKEFEDYHLVGETNLPSSYMEKMDILFFPSFNKYEMMSMVVVECGVLGVPVVSWDIEAMEGFVPKGARFNFGDFSGVARYIEERNYLKSPKYDRYYGKREISKMLRERG